MLTWRMNSGRSDDIGLAKFNSGEIGHTKYDSGEIPRGYIPSLTHSQVGNGTFVCCVNYISGNETNVQFPHMDSFYRYQERFRGLPLII
jgi:hypothetical protein